MWCMCFRQSADPMTFDITQMKQEQDLSNALDNKRYFFLRCCCWLGSGNARHSLAAFVRFRMTKRRLAKRMTILPKQLYSIAKGIKHLFMYHRRYVPLACEL